MGSRDGRPPVETLPLFPPTSPSPTAPREGFFPRGITEARDGRVYVGSLSTGEIVRFAPGEITPAPFVRALSQFKGLTAMYASHTTNMLWAS